jgi:hypothetical protein
MTWENYKCQFKERVEKVSRFIKENSSVLDIGAGDMVLREFLPDGCSYQAIDLYEREEGTIVCDLNVRKPRLYQKYDYVVCIGLLEFINDIEKFVKWIEKYINNSILVSYSNLENYGKCLKNKYPNLNILTNDEFVQTFEKYGFKLINQEKTVLNQKIYVFSK